MKKGFAISGLVYSILILFLILIFGILGILGSRKLILDKMKNSLMGELNNELVNGIYIDDSGANYPKLLDKMIPVVYDESKSKWIYANIYEKWYDYDEKMWANAIILKDGVTKAVGQEINENEIALMYVWIPRYKYTLFNAHNEEVSEQQIEITFEKDINSTGTVQCVDAINQTDENGNLISEICLDVTNTTIVNNVSTYTHPAFTFGDEQITGFWVGKFENSTTDDACLNDANVDNCNKDTHIIEIKANSDSLRYINISNMFTSIQNINTNYNIFDADSHMIKNMEWGAIAYLTQSKYGRCTNGVCEEVTINNVSKNTTTYTTQTGCAANEISGSISTICQNEYNTIGGYKASTTGNIYGVYDMNGGSWECNTGIMVDSHGNLSGFLEKTNSKYYDIYTYGTDYQEHSRGKLGDATYESNQWFDNSNKNRFISDNAILFYRSFYYEFTSGSGVFGYGRGDGTPYSQHSSRSILIKE